MNRKLVDNLSTSRRRVGHTAVKEKKMKTYQVEFRRVSFVTVSIEAESEDGAEQKAWDYFDTDTSYFKECGNADWTIETITEETNENK